MCRSSFRVFVFPIDVARREAGLLEQLAELDDLPQAPVVAECALDQASVAEAEVDVRLERPRQRIEGRLLPDVREAFVLVRFEARLLRGHPSEEIDEEEALRRERSAHRSEVSEELAAFLEDEVAEVVGHDDVEAFASARTLAHVGGLEREARMIACGFFCSG